jgi:hypothetical protein
VLTHGFYHPVVISSSTTHPPLLLMTSFTFSISTSACAMSHFRSYSPFLRFIFDKCQVAVQRRLCIVRSQVLGSAMLFFLLVFAIVARLGTINDHRCDILAKGYNKVGARPSCLGCMFFPIKPCIVPSMNERQASDEKDCGTMSKSRMAQVGARRPCSEWGRAEISTPLMGMMMLTAS